MGGASSKELNEPLIGYKFPTDRVKMRQVRNYPTDAEAAQFDPTADKYDYLIVFNRPVDEGVDTSRDDEGDEKKSEERLSWIDIVELWFQAISGDEDKKNAGVEWLRSEWLSRFRTGTISMDEGGDRITKVAFEGLVREHVIDVLVRKSGLQLNLTISPNGKQIYCRVRAPAALLERKADQLDYKLKFRGEVDPGRAFWQKWADHGGDNLPIYVELQEELTLYEKNKANEILEDLYHAGKISSTDMAVFDLEEPSQKQWSRRVHTLERIADRVPVLNRYPAHASFSCNPKERHLYEEYPSVRGRTLFLPKDRVYLTKRILDETFDFGVLVRGEVIVACTALHDASFGETPTLDWFLKNWVFPWQSTPALAGAPRVSNVAVEKGRVVARYLAPWSQPLMEIRLYFGEQIALYFAWLGFYGLSLTTPAFVALAFEIYDLATGSQIGTGTAIHYDMILFGFFIVIWAAYYKEGWEIEQQYCAVKWGTLNFEQDEADRPQFKGDSVVPRRISPITNQSETYYPESKREWSQIVSFFVVTLCIVFLVSCIVLVFELQFLLITNDFPRVASGASLLQAVLIQVFSSVYREAAYWLNEQENYRTQTAYENNLILKKFFFEVFNNYSALAITAFFKDTYFQCSTRNDCIADLEQLLFIIFATRFAVALYSVFQDRIAKCCSYCCCCCCCCGGDAAKDADAKKKKEGADEYNPMQTNSNADADDDAELGGVAEGADHPESKLREINTPRFEAELDKEEYDGTFDDYCEIVLQMGLVTCFTLGCYYVPLFACAEVLLQIRVDAYKLSALTRRPDAMPAESVGSWSFLMDAMGLLAVYSNAGIVIFTTNSFNEYNFNEKLLAFFVLEQLYLAAKIVTHLLIPDEPLDLKLIKKRQAFVVQRHKNVVFAESDDEDDGDGEAGARADDGRRHRGHVDRDLLNNSSANDSSEDLKGATKLKFDWLLQRLKSCESEIGIARGQYKLACRTEVFNDELGVSYSRRSPDLALGMITLTVLEAENIGTRADPCDPKNCRLIVQLRDNNPKHLRDKLGYGAIGPGPQVSKPAKAPPRKAPGVTKESLAHGTRLVFNQSFSLAPVKSIKGEIFIEIMDDVKRIRRGSVTQNLDDLVSQAKKSLTLSVQRGPHHKHHEHDEPAVLYVKVQFQFSKIAPIKKQIFTLLDAQRKLKRDITNIQLGKEPEHDWEFPDSFKEATSEEAKEESKED